MGGDEEVDDEGPDEEEIDEGDELKPGQREITPSPGNADRVFYETLLAQVSSVGRSRSCVASLRVLSIARLQFKSVRLRLTAKADPTSPGRRCHHDSLSPSCLFSGAPSS